MRYRNEVKHRFTALGAYIFAGGFTLGVRKHFEVLAHFEDGPYGVETALRNNIITKAYQEPARWPIEEYRGKVNFLYANPPCAPWSMASAGRSTHWTQDPRINAVKRCYRLLEQLEPDAWAWESVRPAWLKGRELVESVARAAMKRGYHATALLVNGIHHGVPQARKRFFLVLHKRPIPWEATNQKRVLTVRDALLTGPSFKTQTYQDKPSPSVQWFLRILKPGQRPAVLFAKAHPELVARHRPGIDKMRGRPSFQWSKLNPDKPGPVLTGGCLSIHPTKHRLITVEESAALCGYPRWFKFYGALGRQYAQVAQAVMPPVAEYLARMVRQSLEYRGSAANGRPVFERVEIFPDHIDREQLQLLGGAMSLRLTEPTPAPKLRTIAEQARLDNLEHARAVKSVKGARIKRVNGDSAPRVPFRGSGYRIRELLKAGREPEHILTVIHREFPDSKATRADVSWNKRKLRLQGGVP